MIVYLIYIPPYSSYIYIYVYALCTRTCLFTAPALFVSTINNNMGFGEWWVVGGTGGTPPSLPLTPAPPPHTPVLHPSEVRP